MTRRLLLFAGVCIRAVSGGRPESPATLERRVFEAINFQRQGALSALRWNDALSRVARAHSQRMSDARFFSHEDPLFGGSGTRLSAAGIDWTMCAENIFRERNYEDPVSIAVIEWMYSPGHRDNIMSAEYEETGVGVALDAEGNHFITQEFLLQPERRKRLRVK